MGWGGLYAAGRSYGAGGTSRPSPGGTTGSHSPGEYPDPAPPQGGSGLVRVGFGPVVRALLFCPRCRGQHVDRDEWATRSHKTHLCEHCKHEWQAAEVPTVGVEAL